MKLECVTFKNDLEVYVVVENDWEDEQLTSYCTSHAAKLILREFVDWLISNQYPAYVVNCRNIILRYFDPRLLVEQFNTKRRLRKANLLISEREFLIRFYLGNGRRG